MKFLLWSLAFLTVISSCASSSKKRDDNIYPNAVTLQKPGEQPNRPSRVYIDSVKKITVNKKEALLVKGTFPDACTMLENVVHRIQNDMLYLEFKAWRNPEKMCAQVLTPFTFIYDRIEKSELSSHSEVIINDTAYRYQ